MPLVICLLSLGCDSLKLTGDWKAEKTLYVLPSLVVTVFTESSADPGSYPSATGSSFAGHGRGVQFKPSYPSYPCSAKE